MNITPVSVRPVKNWLKVVLGWFSRDEVNINGTIYLPKDLAKSEVTISLMKERGGDYQAHKVGVTKNYDKYKINPGNDFSIFYIPKDMDLDELVLDLATAKNDSLPTLSDDYGL